MPTFHGDTIYAETRVLDKKESGSKPDRGIVDGRDAGVQPAGRRGLLLPPQGDGAQARGGEAPRASVHVGGVTPGCKFCQIIAGEIPAHFVLDTDEVVAFLDHRPLFPGHTLVLPREHIETLADLPPDRVGPFFLQVQRVEAAVRTAMEAQGSFVAENNVVSQSVPHLHVHVVPRRRKDGLRGFFWPRTKYASDGEMAAVAARITEQLV